MTKYNYILKSVIVSCTLMSLLLIGFLAYFLNILFWTFFNFIIVHLCIYYLCIDYFKKYKDKLKCKKSKNVDDFYKLNLDLSNNNINSQIPKIDENPKNNEENKSPEEI